jgi:predicted CXXCH cytochrome family protein
LGPILQDPARPGKPFYCGSCHNPHSADNSYLFRFKAKSSGSLCSNCHNM